MMLIYDAPVRTMVGPGRIQITDTQPDEDTPTGVPHTAPAQGGIRLQQGDTGQADDNLPRSIGSFFDLTFADTHQRDYQRFFGGVFDESRCEVTLTIPGKGWTWRGYVRSTLQSRSTSRKTGPGTVDITCYDGVGALKGEDSSLDAFKLSVREFLVQCFAEANPDLDIVLYVDPTATDVDGATADTSRLVPYADQENTYSPQTSEPNGLKGDTLREQLDELCGTFLAAAYQDVRLGAWAVVDLASIGAPVQGARYDAEAGTWSPYTFPEQTATVDEVRNERDDRLERMPSTKEVCSKVTAINIDPDLEQFSALGSEDTLFHWDHPNCKVFGLLTARNFETIVDLEPNPGNLSQTVDLDILVGGMSAIGVTVGTETDWSDGNYEVTVEVTYGDGTTTSATEREGDHSFNVEGDGYNWYADQWVFPLDTTKQSIHSIYLLVSHEEANDDPSGTVGLVKAELLYEDDVVRPDGETVTKRRRVDELCFQAAGGGEGRRSVKDERGGVLTELQNGGRATPVQWSSAKLSGSYSKLWVWRAAQILALQPPGYEKLKGQVNGEYIPLGTRIEWTKPGDSVPTVFVPFKGRVLHMDTSDADAATEVKDVEIPAPVIDLLP